MQLALEKKVKPFIPIGHCASTSCDRFKKRTMAIQCADVPAEPFSTLTCIVLFDSS